MEIEKTDIALRCRDGVRLAGQLWQSRKSDEGTIIINSATGVLARYYHRYAAFLAGHGYSVLTYDYRGIGLSAPQDIRTCGYRWKDWGEQDFDAALRFMVAEKLPGPMQVIGHSIGGFLPGFSPLSHRIDRMLTVGAQYAYWRDYSKKHRLKQIIKWHIAMPIMTFGFGYFPGRQLGWLENLPAGVANEWSFRRRDMERNYPPDQRLAILASFGSVAAAILAVGISDDEIASSRAIARTLGYYSSATKTHVQLTPQDFATEEIGHFGFFHDRHKVSLWQDSLQWLSVGENPWRFAEMPRSTFAD